jgi:hypothetical protein
MRTSSRFWLVVVTSLTCVTLSHASDCFPDLPLPQVEITDKEDYETPAGEWTRYRLSVVNWPVYPAELFEPAPDLAPCGSNTNASRTWVRIHAADGGYIYGFCALSDPSDLTLLWFAVPRGEAPPDEVYIVLNDRRCGIAYTSDLVPTRVCYPDLPAPRIEVTGTEEFTSGGTEYTRVLLSVTNWTDYPDELFAAAPDLPPCGLNDNAARTWVRILGAGGDYIYGFCALSSPSSLQDIWFAVPSSAKPPSVTVVLRDRHCAVSYTSDPVALTVPSETVSWGRAKAMYR